MPKLENWGVCWSTDDPYCPPECLTQNLQGNVSDSPNFPDSAFIVTSRIISADMGKDGLITATTNSGTKYILGNPAPEFVKVLAEKGQTIQDALATLLKFGK